MISANERNRLWTPEHQAQYDRAEGLIDRAIRDSETDAVTVDISNATTNRRVTDRLCDAYREGGWTVQAIGQPALDQGVYLKLQVAGAPRSGPGVG